MEVNQFIVSNYLSNLMSYTEDHAEIPASLSVYDEVIERIRNTMNCYHETEALRLGFAYLLTHPEIKLRSYYHIGEYPYQEKDIHRALRYLYDKIWPTFPTKEEIETVRFVNTLPGEWRESLKNDKNKENV